MNAIGSNSKLPAASTRARGTNTASQTTSTPAEPADGFEASSARRDRIARTTVISGLGLFAGGLATLGYAATAALATSPVLLMVGSVALAAGLVTTLTGATYGDNSSSSSSISGTIADPANPLSPLNVSNPANPVNLMMHS